MLFNYQKICQDLLRDLPPRTKEVISRRFGLKAGQKETLESIGRVFDITRERVRQIEEDGFFRLRPKLQSPRLSPGELQKTFQHFERQLKTAGDLKKEDILLEQFGGKKEKPQVYFLLTLGPNFERFGESDDFYSLWTINQNSLVLAKRVIDSFYKKLREGGTPLSLKELSSFIAPKEPFFSSYLEVSKKIQQNFEGQFGLKDWPEISPRGIKDKAYLVLKKTETPLHFNQVASLIGKEALPQTVHNELIKDSRFVLVGRGIYALKIWGYEPGQVKDIIFKVLKEAKKPLTKKEILEKVLKQRLVKENTISLNLSNKKYFLRTLEGKYRIVEV